MENTMKMYVTADEAAQILGVSRGYGLNMCIGEGRIDESRLCRKITNNMVK